MKIILAYVELHKVFFKKKLPTKVFKNLGSHKLQDMKK